MFGVARASTAASAPPLPLAVEVRACEEDVKPKRLFRMLQDARADADAAVCRSSWFAACLSAESTGAASKRRQFLMEWHKMSPEGLGSVFNSLDGS